MMTGRMRWILIPTLLVGVSHATPDRDLGGYLDLAVHAEAAAKAGDPGSALGDYAQAIELAAAADDRVAVAALLFRAAALVESEGQLQQGLRLYERVLDTLDADRVSLAGPGGVLDELAAGGGKVFSPRSRATVYPDLFHGGFDRLDVFLVRPDAAQRLAVLACVRAGNLYLVQGQFEPAQTLYARALARLEDGDPELSRQVALNRTWLAIKAGELDEADQRLGAVFDGTVPDPVPPSLRRAVIAVGVNRREQGRTADALRWLEQGVSLHRAAGDDLGTARALAHLGSAYLLADRTEAARTAYEDALALNRQLDDREVALHATAGLARTLRGLGQPAAARDRYADYVERVQRLGATLATDQGKVSFLQDHAILFGEYAATALELAERNDDWAAARQAIESVRSRSLGPLRRYRGGAGEAPPGALVWQPPRLAIDGHRMMVQSAAGLGTRAAGSLDTPVGSHLALPESFREPVAAAGALAAGEAELRDTTLLEYYVLPERTAIIVRQPDGNVVGAVSGLGASALRERVRRYRDALGLDGDRGIGIAVGAPRRTSAPAAEVEATARELHAALVGPILAYLPSEPAADVVVVPHDALWLLPFAALHDGEGYLGTRHTLSQASSGADWLDSVARERKGPAGGRAWIVGNPQLQPQVRACGDSYALSPLPGAEREARAIAGLFGVDRSDLFIGGEADRLRLDAWHGAYRVIHLATHGVVCPDRPLDSFVLLAALDQADVGLDAEGTRLVRSGDPRLPVTLLGSELRAIDADAEDTRELLAGFVYPGLLNARTLAERYRLNADLVTLSACQTGLGSILGEGVIGLSRSLLAAGARSVLLSLWRVDDAATEDLMVAFYHRYLAHGDKALALRQAMAETRERFPHPRDWAGFVLLGAAQ